MSLGRYKMLSIFVNKRCCSQSFELSDIGDLAGSVKSDSLRAHQALDILHSNGNLPF